MPLLLSPTDAADPAAGRHAALAIDEERRRLGRDLHDGVQQSVVAAGYAIEAARLALPVSDGPAHASLARAQECVRRAVEDLRAVTRGLQPLALTRDGLGPALRRMADAAPLRVDVAAVPDLPLPPAVAVAAFHLVSEALTNAGRHSDGTAVTIAVAVERDEVTVTVSDDGIGGASPQTGAGSRGSGLVGMAERAAGLGGRLTVDSPAGVGTTVRARLPLGPRRPPPFICRG